VNSPDRTPSNIRLFYAYIFVALLQTTFKVLGLGMLVGMSLVLPPLRREVTT